MNSVELHHIYKIRDALEYDSFYDFVSDILTNNDKITYKLFCEIFSLYVYGAVFVTISDHFNFFYTNLRNLGAVDFVKDMHHVHPYSRLVIFVNDMDNVPHGIHVLKSFCQISSELLNCIKAWDVKDEFDALYKSVAKGVTVYYKTFHNHYEVTHNVLSRPVKERYSDELQAVWSAINQNPEIDNTLHKFWETHHISVASLVKCFNPIDVYNLINDTDIQGLNRFLKYLKDEFFIDPPENKIHRFVLDEVTPFHYGYGENGLPFDPDLDL